MSRYVDIDKADVEQISCFYGSECRLEDVKEWLDSLPTINVSEEKYGAWKHYSTTMMECSNCGRHVARHRYAFCSHCGVKMKGGII